LLKAKALREVHDTICHQVANPPTLVLSVLLDIWEEVDCNFSLGHVLAKDNTGINALHLDRVLLVLEELSKDLKELTFGHLRDHFNHLIEGNGSNLSDLRDLILGNLNKHLQKFLLAHR
jgi:hypothetical protein